MFFNTGWSALFGDRSIHLKSSFGVVIFFLILLALGGMIVHAAPSAQEATEVPCPAPDTNGSSLITEYTIPTADSGPWGIAAGSDGALWYGTANGRNIGHITTTGQFTEFPFPLAHDGDQRFLVAGPDGAEWFNDDWQNKIGRISNDGKITEYPIPSGVGDADDSGTTYITSLPRGLVTGADGALWFSENEANIIGRITVDGAVTEYPLPTFNAGPVGLALGSDGAVWFTEKLANQIGRISPDGKITEYPVPTANSFLLRIAAGADGALWFSEFSGNNIGRISTDGVITEFALPPCAGPVGMTAGTDGAVWFTEYKANKIGRISMNGQITEYVIPTAESVPFSIVSGSDGALWFTENGSSKIGRLQVK